MIRHALAHLLHRVELYKPEPEIQYVYVYSAPPTTTWPTTPYWQGPWCSGTTVNY